MTLASCLSSLSANRTQQNIWASASFFADAIAGITMRAIVTREEEGAAVNVSKPTSWQGQLP